MASSACAFTQCCAHAQLHLCSMVQAFVHDVLRLSTGGVTSEAHSTFPTTGVWISDVLLYFSLQVARGRGERGRGWIISLLGAPGPASSSQVSYDFFL